MKIKTLLTLGVIMLLVSCGKTSTTKSVHTQGDAVVRMEQLYRNGQFQEALAVCDSMLTDDDYLVDTLSADDNNRRYITIMRRRIVILGYLSRQTEAVEDMKTLAQFCNSKEDDKENSYSSVAAQMNVKIGLTQIDMGKTEEGFAMIDKGIDAMRNEKSKNARLATVNFMHDKARVLDEQNRQDEAIAVSSEALQRMKDLREMYAEGIAKKEDKDVQEFCDFYEGNFYALLAYVYVNKAENGKPLAADSVRFYYDKAMSVPHWSEMSDCDIMMLATYGFLGMQTEFDRAYRQVEKDFSQDTLSTYYINVQRFAARMAVKKGDNARAMALMQRVERLQALHNKKNSMKSVAEAANAYEVAEMERTHKEMEVSRLTWIIIAVCMAVVTLAACIIFFYLHRRNRHAYQQYTATTQDEVKEGVQGVQEVQEGQDNTTEPAIPESVSFLAALDKVLLTDGRIFAENFSRKDIVRDMEMPMIHILSRLKEFTGCTLSTYITQKRLEHAANLLLTTNEKVESICFNSGFNSVATFYRLFAKRYGCPPAEYRASHEA